MTQSVERIPSEKEEQIALVNWARRNQEYPELRLLHAIHNSTPTTPKVALQQKLMGTVRGIPDLFLPVARGGYHGIYIELKRSKGGSVSADQKTTIAALQEQGYRVEVCHGADQAKRVLLQYLKQR